jgi:hypothetical protein
MPPVDKKQLKELLLKVLAEKGDYDALISSVDEMDFSDEQKAEAKEAALQMYVEKGEYKKALAVLRTEEKKRQEGIKTEKMSSVLDPIAAFSDLVTNNTKGVFMGELSERLDSSMKDSVAQFQTDFAAAKEEYAAALEAGIKQNADTLTADIQTRIETAKTALEATVVQLADQLITAKASEMFSQLADQARLTPEELAQLVDDAALSVESQIANVIGLYVAEQGITVDQIKDFETKVKALIPEIETNQPIDWSRLRNVPATATGGTSRNLIKQLAWVNGNTTNPNTLTVSATAPTNPKLNDLWVEVL